VGIFDRSTVRTLIIPGGVLTLGVTALVYSGWPTLALPAISFLYYCALFGGMLLAWRFHSSRSFLSLLVILMAQQAATLCAGSPVFVAAVGVLSVLVPVNFVLIAIMHEHGFTLESIAPVGLFLFVQTLTVTVLLGSMGARPSALVHARHLPGALTLPPYAWYVVVAGAVFLFVRFILTRKPIDSALLWSLCTIVLAIRHQEVARTSAWYWAAAASIVAISIVENSYLLAYHDELTTLPSRRAFNDALQGLKHPYSVAVVDIDHFKRFNDTYGHDTGDQVLRLVAANLARVTGGGQAYRCGGEEFNILFGGKTTSDVVDHLEQLRQKIETSEFRLRGNDRRQAPRGPERRVQRGRGRGRPRKADMIRQLAQENSGTALSVTVSIGIASSSERSDFETVLKAADRALYRAKENGRNRVETAAPVQRTRRSKAAGIA
jgi:GGDEF domain-containing protein